MALLGLAAIVAALVLGFTVFGESSSHATRPSLRVVKKVPLTVRGSHFRSRESVRITAAAKSVSTKASGDGTFVVTIGGSTRCDVVRLLARGSAGSYVVLKVLPSPMCLPARSG